MKLLFLCFWVAVLQCLNAKVHGPWDCHLDEISDVSIKLSEKMYDDVDEAEIRFRKLQTEVYQRYGFEMNVSKVSHVVDLPDTVLPQALSLSVYFDGFVYVYWDHQQKHHFHRLNVKTVEWETLEAPEEAVGFIGKPVTLIARTSELELILFGESGSATYDLLRKKWTNGRIDTQGSRCIVYDEKKDVGYYVIPQDGNIFVYSTQGFQEPTNRTLVSWIHSPPQSCVHSNGIIYFYSAEMNFGMINLEGYSVEVIPDIPVHNIFPLDANTIWIAASAENDYIYDGTNLKLIEKEDLHSPLPHSCFKYQFYVYCTHDQGISQWELYI